MVALDKSSLLEVIDSHKSDEIIEVLKAQPLELREAVKEVSVDMWGGFPKVIREVFPKAKIVIARFPVIKLVNKALNKIRLLLELKGLKNRYLLLKKYRELNPDEQQELKSLLAQSPCWEIADELKEEIISFYETTTTVKMGLRKLNKWLNLARILFKETAQTLAKYTQEICPDRAIED